MKSILLLLFLSFAVIFYKCKIYEETPLLLIGKINKSQESVFDLKVRDNQVAGVFYYLNTEDDTILIRGNINGEKIMLEEYSSKNNVVTGFFEGEYDGITFTGIWTSPNGKKQVPFVFQTTEVIPKKENLFSGKAFFIGDLRNDDECEVESRCDCCAAVLLLLDNQSFVDYFYCIHSSEDYSKGIYNIKDNKLHLTVKKSVDIEYDFDEEGNELESKTTSDKEVQYIYSISTCRNKIILKNKLSYGTLCGNINNCEYANDIKNMLIKNGFIDR